MAASTDAGVSRRALVATALLSTLLGGASACASKQPGSPPATDRPSPAATGTTRTGTAQSGTTHLAVAGDTGTGPGTRIEDTVRAMVTAGASQGYDGLVLLGDLVYPEGDAAQADARVGQVFDPVTREGARLVPVLGNHDYRSGEQEQLLRALGRRTTWYAQTIGLVRIVVLDSERVGDPEQRAWLQRTLASTTTAPWTIVAMHRPAYSAGHHGSDPEIQAAWVPLFEQYDVPLVLAGHDHDYQRSRPIDGVTYVVSGGAVNLRPTGRADFTAVSASVRHFLDLTISQNRLEGRAIDQSGGVLDSFVISR